MVTATHDAVSVDGQFVRAGGKSFAVNKITSVEVRADPAPKDSGGFGLIIVAILVAIVGIGFPPLLLLAALLGFMGWRASRKKPVRTYRVLLMLASTEAAALVTNDEAQALSLRDDIERAMANS